MISLYNLNNHCAGILNEVSRRLVSEERIKRINTFKIISLEANIKPLLILDLLDC